MQPQRPAKPCTSNQGAPAAHICNVLLPDKLKSSCRSALGCSCYVHIPASWPLRPTRRRPWSVSEMASLDPRLVGLQSFCLKVELWADVQGSRIVGLKRHLKVSGDDLKFRTRNSGLEAEFRRMKAASLPQSHAEVRSQSRRPQQSPRQAGGTNLGSQTLSASCLRRYQPAIHSEYAGTQAWFCGDPKS